MDIHPVRAPSELQSMPTELIEKHEQTKFVIGDNSIDELGALARELGAQRALVFSDPGIVRAGHTSRGIAALVAADIEAEVYSEIEENPTTKHVEAGVAFASEFEPDLIVGLGGGSSMDCAKGVNFVLTNGGRMQDYWGVGKATQPMLPMIAVPTTAGTGSEAQSFALISDADSHVKMACGDKKAAFRIAVLDPLLTLTQPAAVTAVTGMDAISHAIETLVCTKRTELSMQYSTAAWERLAMGFEKVLREPDDLESRRQMQVGASLAGMAIENSMLGAAHATANPLTANYGIVHGCAVGMMLPHVVRLNAETNGDDYQRFASVVEKDSAHGLAEYLSELLNCAGMKRTLQEYDIPRDKFPKLAEEAAKQWTANFNPVRVGQAEMLRLYEAAYS